MKNLKSKLHQLELEEKERELASIRGEQKDIGWGSQIRSYVFTPYTMVKDHRTNYEVSTVDKVMDGEIIDFIDAYLHYNMKEKVEPVKYIVDIASEAIRQAGVEPKVKPIRGGTDGAQLSFKGLPCPNIFAGGHNFHGKYEFVPIQSMKKATEVVKNIIKIVANR